MTEKEFWASFPTSVNVGHMVYQIDTVEGFEGPEDPKVQWGQCGNINGTITVSRKCWNDALAVSTLLHEICHAYHFVFGVAGKTPHEEATCLKFETFMLDLMIQNPKLISWIQKVLK
jgi:hypothetical protein